MSESRELRVRRRAALREVEGATTLDSGSRKRTRNATSEDLPAPSSGNGSVENLQERLEARTIEYAKVVHSLDASKDELGDVLALVENQRKESEAQKKRMQEAERVHEAMSLTLERLKAETVDAEKKAQEASNACGQLQILQSGREHALAELTQQRDAMQELKTGVVRDLDRVSSERDAIRGQHADLAQDVRRLTEERERMFSMNRSASQDLQGATLQRDALYAEVHAVVKPMLKEVEMLRTETTEAEQVVEQKQSLMQDFKKSREERDAMTTEIQCLKTASALYSQEIERQRQTLTNVSQDIATKQDASAEVIQRLKEQESELRASVNLLQKEDTRLQTAFSLYSQEIEGQRKTLQNLSDDIATEQNASAEMIRAGESRIQRLKEQEVELKATVDRLRADDLRLMECIGQKKKMSCRLDIANVVTRMVKHNACVSEMKVLLNQNDDECKVLFHVHAILQRHFTKGFRALLESHGFSGDGTQNTALKHANSKTYCALQLARDCYNSNADFTILENTIHIRRLTTAQKTFFPFADFYVDSETDHLFESLRAKAREDANRDASLWGFSVQVDSPPAVKTQMDVFQDEMRRLVESSST